MSALPVEKSVQYEKVVSALIEARDLLAPVASYDSKTRTSKSLIDLTGTGGILEAAKKQFGVTVNNEYWVDFAFKTPFNGAVYFLDLSAGVKEGSFYQWCTVHTSGNCDPQRHPNRLGVHYNDFIVRIPKFDKYQIYTESFFESHLTPEGYGLLTSLLKYLLETVPLIAILMPQCVDVDSTARIARSSVYEIIDGCNLLVLSGAVAGPKLLNDIRSPNSGLSEISQSPTLESLKNKLVIVDTKSRRQLLALFATKGCPRHGHLYQRLKQILSSQVLGITTLGDQIVAEFERLIQTVTVDDEELYNCLHDFFYTKVVTDREYIRRKNLKGSKRERSRADEITKIARTTKPGFTPTMILDVGCSEGSITGSLGEAFKLPRNQVYGCDVRDLGDNDPRFTFSRSAGSDLPYLSESFDFITSLMVFHHIEDIKGMLSEIKRVSKPGSILLFREHDLIVPGLAMVIDVMHGLYTRTWREKPIQPSFCDVYYAEYRSRAGWSKLLTETGFRQLPKSPDTEKVKRLSEETMSKLDYIPNPFEVYYGAWSV